MVSLVQRMTRLKTKLLGIRIGPGAAILPRNVQKIHMEFAFRISGGHAGARKFWRHNMPRLKYYNPAVLMTVNRSHDQSAPSVMTVFFNTPQAVASGQASHRTSSTGNPTTSTSGDKAPSDYIPSGNTHTIDMKRKTDDQILKEFMELTKAVDVKPTEEELQTLRELEEQVERSQKDSERQKVINAEKKRQQALLDAAKGEAGLA